MRLLDARPSLRGSAFHPSPSGSLAFAAPPPTPCHLRHSGSIASASHHSPSGSLASVAPPPTPCRPALRLCSLRLPDRRLCPQPRLHQVRPPAGSSPLADLTEPWMRDVVMLGEGILVKLRSP